MTRGLRFGVLLLGMLLLGMSLLSARATGESSQHEDDDVLRCMNDHHRAAELYVAGNAPAAFEILDQCNVAEQRLVAKRIPDAMKVPLPQSAFRVAQLWNPRLVYALAALHMEAALRAYAERDTTSRGQLTDHIEIGKVLFKYLDAKTDRPNAAPRWELAIGLTALADGQPGWAELVLDEACRDHSENRPLLLACGSVHEAIAMLPADVLMQTGRRRPSVRPAAGDVPVLNDEFRFSDDTMRGVRSMHDFHLGRARQHFEQLLRADPNNVEARIRLAHVRTMTGDDARAVPLLESIVSGKIAADARADYLVRLLLGGIKQRAGQLDAAAAALEQAVADVPSGQSAFIALAQVAYARGDAAGAAVVIKRMLEAPTGPDDPWWGYRFGQYWVVAPVLATLRKEVLQ